MSEPDEIDGRYARLMSPVVFLRFFGALSSSSKSPPNGRLLLVKLCTSFAPPRFMGRTASGLSSWKTSSSPVMLSSESDEGITSRASFFDAPEVLLLEVGDELLAGRIVSFGTTGLSEDIGDEIAGQVAVVFFGGSCFGRTIFTGFFSSPVSLSSESAA
jgi:hypothetical protein